MSPKKPWPTDALIIVCSTLEKAKKSKMRSINEGACHYCGCDIVYEGETLKYAMSLPILGGRRIDFMCTDCCLTYDRNTVDELHGCRNIGFEQDIIKTPRGVSQ